MGRGLITLIITNAYEGLLGGERPGVYTHIPLSRPLLPRYYCFRILWLRKHMLREVQALVVTLVRSVLLTLTGYDQGFNQNKAAQRLSTC